MTAPVLRQIASADEWADREEAEGHPERASRIRAINAEWLGSWLGEQLTEGPALVMGVDGEWRLDPDFGPDEAVAP